MDLSFRNQTQQENNDIKSYLEKSDNKSNHSSPLTPCKSFATLITKNTLSVKKTNEPDKSTQKRYQQELHNKNRQIIELKRQKETLLVMNKKLVKQQRQMTATIKELTCKLQNFDIQNSSKEKMIQQRIENINKIKKLQIQSLSTKIQLVEKLKLESEKDLETVQKQFDKKKIVLSQKVELIKKDYECKLHVKQKQATKIQEMLNNKKREFNQQTEDLKQQISVVKNQNFRINAANIELQQQNIDLKSDLKHFQQHFSAENNTLLQRISIQKEQASDLNKILESMFEKFSQEFNLSFGNQGIKPAFESIYEYIHRLNKEKIKESALSQESCSLLRRQIVTMEQQNQDLKRKKEMLDQEVSFLKIHNESSGTFKQRLAQLQSDSVLNNQDEYRRKSPAQKSIKLKPIKKIFNQSSSDSNLYQKINKEINQTFKQVAKKRKEIIHNSNPIFSHHNEQQQKKQALQEKKKSLIYIMYRSKEQQQKETTKKLIKQVHDLRQKTHSRSNSFLQKKRSQSVKNLVSASCKAVLE